MVTDTVGGRNPAPVHMQFVPLFTRFIHPGGARFLPSTVAIYYQAFQECGVGKMGSCFSDYMIIPPYSLFSQLRDHLSEHMRSVQNPFFTPFSSASCPQRCGTQDHHESSKV